MVKGAAAACVGVLLLASTASADVRLTISNGQVSLSARNATLGQILSEWSKAGPTRIVNGDRVTGGLMNIELANVSEVQALDVILRTAAAGYLLAPRQTPAANGSRFDRILILPASLAARPAAASVPPAAFSRAPFNQAPSQPDAAEEPESPEQPAAAPQNPRPVFRTFQPQAPPRTETPSSPAPAPRPEPSSGSPMLVAPAGVTTPGMVPAAPASAAPGTPEDSQRH